MNFEIKNGFFSYSDEQILKDISFNVQEAEILSVLGPNGIGKTTLLKCMMGLLKWDKGETYLDDIPIKKISNRDLWKTIAYVPQAKGSALSFTALEMVLMGRSAHLNILAQPSSKDRKIALETMKSIGIDFLKNQLCSEMSGGELQMVLLARALCSNPKFLVLDEPESNLDFKNQLIILDTIQHLSNEFGIASIVNTHYPTHALKISNKTLILKKNGEYLYGDTKSIINESNLCDAFNVNIKIQDFNYENTCYKTVIPISYTR